MSPEEQARVQASEAGALKEKGWTSALVEAEDCVVLRRNVPPAEEALVVEAYEHLARHYGTVRALEGKGWTVGEVRFLRADCEYVRFRDGKAVTEFGPPLLQIEAVAEVEGHELAYTLHEGGHEEWFHMFEGLGLNVAENATHLNAPAGKLASPEQAHTFLSETVERGREQLASEVYGYLLAQCGPGEEPDPDEFERLTGEFWPSWARGVGVGDYLTEVIEPEPAPAGPDGRVDPFDGVYIVKRPES